ncbi:MAG: FadR/GntR family transcriptional regulator [Bacteroidota bacterium]
MLEKFSAIQVDSTVDKIIKQIRKLITSGQLTPGDRLPSERKLAEILGVSRKHVRDAIQKLEFYGILKTLPQSGTFVAGIGIVALQGLITDVLKLEKSDFASLVETRVILETSSARLAAQRRTSENITAIQEALDAYELKVKSGANAIEEDLMFHMEITKASKNSVLNSLMTIITPNIITNYVELKVCSNEQDAKVINEHRLILQYIIEQNDEAASQMMHLHLQDVVKFSLKQ